MGKTVLDVEILFSSSKAFDPQIKEIRFGKYKIKSIPTARESLEDTRENHILEFKDLWKNEQMNSDPEREGGYVLSLLSLILEMKTEFDSIKVNNVQGTIRKRRSLFLNGKAEFPSDFEDLFRKLQFLKEDVLRQYLRSCDAYKVALYLIDNNPTLSFYLLVTAVEAIANKVIRSKSQRHNFMEFIFKYVPDYLKKELGDEKLLQALIEEAYNMRCAFTHGGTEISIATLSADFLNRKYVKHYIKEKERYSPSIKWFESVVRAVLIGFLRDQRISWKRKSKLNELAMKEKVIYLKLSKSVKLGQLITTEDVDLDFQKDA